MKDSPLSRILLPVAAVVAFFLLWWLVASLAIVPAYYLPSPGEVLGRLVTPAFIFVAGTHLLCSLERAGGGFAMAILLGVSLGLAIGRSVTFARLASPIVEFLRPLPSSAVIPIALLFLGLGNTMHLAVIAFGCMWPILVSTADGTRSIEPTFLDVSHLLRLRRSQRIVFVLLPAIAPFVATGLRTSVAVALILAVTTEMIAGSDGIGFFILDMERSFRVVDMYAAITLLGLTGYSINALFVLVQRKALFWSTNIA